MTPIVNPKHYLGIDVLRFFAALIVMWFHHGFYLAGHPNDWPNQVSKGLVQFPELSDWSFFGYVGVQIFFVISGFVIAFSGERASPSSFLISRIVRLGPGVWICASITLLAVISVGLGSLYQVKLFVQSVLFVPVGTWIDGAYWTLGIEIAFYALVGLLIYLNKFLWITRLAIVIGAYSSLYWIVVSLGFFELGGEISKTLYDLRRDRTLDLMLVHHGIFFGLGVLLWSELTKSRTSAHSCWAVLFCIIGCLQIIHTASGAKNPNLSPFIACLIWIFSVGGIILSVRFNSIIHRAPQWLLRAVKIGGLMTFPLYLLHQVVGNAIMGAAVQMGANRWGALGVAVFLTLFLSLVIVKYLEPPLQAKTKKILSQLQERWGSRTYLGASPTK